MRPLATVLFVILLPIVLIVGIETAKSIPQLSSDGPGRDDALANTLLFIVTLVFAIKAFGYSILGSKGRRSANS